MEYALSLRDVRKSYGKSIILDGINLGFISGKMHCILGKSGAGKTTLLRCMNTIEKIDDGGILIDGIDAFAEHNIRNIREKIGCIFQHFNLLARRTALGNVMLPMEISGVENAKKKAKEALNEVGLIDKCDCYPGDLSGGQKQRVAIARALVMKPKILLCDEPTSALDPASTLDIISLLKNLNKELGITIIIITHQMSVVKKCCDYLHIMSGGNIVESGEILDIFKNCQNEEAREFIDSALDRHIPEVLQNKLSDHGEKIVLHITFIGEKAEDGVIYDICKELDIAISIISGSINYIKDVMCGTLIITMKHDADVARKIQERLEEQDILSEILGFINE